MDTDKGFVVDYEDVMTPYKQDRLRKLLSGAEGSAVDTFIEAVKHPLSAFHAHAHSHPEHPDARDQERYYARLENKVGKLSKYMAEVDELLDEAPFELRTRASEAGTKIHEIQPQHTALMIAINDITPTKSKFRPEIPAAVKQIAEAFRTAFGVEPVIRAYRQEADIPQEAPVADRFVPVLAELINRSVDHAYRLAREILAS